MAGLDGAEEVQGEVLDLGAMISVGLEAATPLPT